MNKVTKMTEKKKTDVEPKADAETTGDPSLPAFVKAAPELIPLWDWWVKEGKTVMVTLLVVALGAAGFIGIRGYLKGRHTKAAEALVKSNTQEELTAAVAEYGSSDAGTGLKLCLAKNHYDAGRYQDALALYEAVLKDGGKDDPFRDIAELGCAHSLEGLKKYAEASEAFSKYASDEAKSHEGFRLTAQLGVARCKALQGDVAGAEADLKALKDSTSDKMKQGRIEELLTLIKHYDFTREDPNPTDALTLSLDDSEPTPAPEMKPAAAPAKPAPAAPAKPAVAPVKPAAAPAKPVAAPAKPAAAPAKPVAAPAKPAAAPAKPVAAPAKPAAAPAKPAAAPAKPAAAPAKPAAVPAKPPAPAKPAAPAPAKPAQK